MGDVILVLLVRGAVEIGGLAGAALLAPLLLIPRVRRWWSRKPLPSLVDGRPVTYTGDVEERFRALLSGRAPGVGPQ